MQTHNAHTSPSNQLSWTINIVPLIGTTTHECFSFKIKIWVCFHYFWFGLFFRGDFFSFFFFFFSNFCQFSLSYLLDCNLWPCFNANVFIPSRNNFTGFMRALGIAQSESQRDRITFHTYNTLYNTITDEASAITPKCHSRRTHNCVFALFITSFRLCNEKELNQINDHNNINNNKTKKKQNREWNHHGTHTKKMWKQM